MLGFSQFELFVAKRYLRAKRKQAVISVITGISVVGVAAGVMALVIALAINNGFRNTLERSLLGATAHINVLEKEPGYGIENWQALAEKLKKLPHVVSATPGLYAPVFLASPVQSSGAEIKGIPVGPDAPIPDTLRHLKAGSLEGLRATDGYPGIVLGSKLSQSTGLVLNSVAKVVSPQGDLTPFGPRPSIYPARVVGIFESGAWDLDSQWAFTSLATAQKVLSLNDVVNTIELKLDDIQRAPEVAKAAEKIIGPKLSPLTWMEQNRQLRNAFQMEKVVTVVTIGLIQLVAALNILITLIMMVMEKYRDIALLISMGARLNQIRKIFVLQGLLIGVVGTATGLVAGYVVCFFAEHYRWLKLDESVYSLSYVPFEPFWGDGLWIAGTAIFVSFIATLYPARNASKIAPVEALRYE
jgi:lipoprotein-releasing system permease protein